MDSGHERLEWRLILAGPDEAGYRDTVEEEAARLGLMNALNFGGK